MRAPQRRFAERWLQNRAGGDLVEHKAWSVDELDRALKMRRAAEGATAIARELGRTRNSVIAKLWREDEPGILANHNGLTGHGFFSDAKPRPATIRQFTWEIADG